MAKTYNTFTNVATGDVYTASQHNAILTNLGNYRVPPMCYTRGINTSQSLGHGANTNLQWTGADTVDTDDIHDPASNSDRFTIATAGLYLVTGHLLINSTGVTVLGLAITVNASGIYETGSSSPLSASAAKLSLSGIVNCAANDIVRLSVYQESSGSASRTPTSGTMALTWLGQVS